MKLVTTSVVSGNRPGESHGGVYLVDLGAREILRTVDWDGAGTDPQGRNAGLRGIAIDGDTVYVAAGDELLAYTPDFRPAGSWRNPYLRDCQAMAVWERRLFLVVAGCDAILGFDLDRKEFSWAMQVVAQNYRFQARGFDPRGDDGPLLLDKLHLNSIHCAQGGMYLTGLKTGGMLLFNGREIRMAVELPRGTHDARPFRNGVLFNDSEAGLLRYSGRDGAEDRAFPVQPGLARGLAVLSEAQVAGGSSPATICVYDLPRNQRLLSVNLAVGSDGGAAIHSLAAWPF